MDNPDGARAFADGAIQEGRQRAGEGSPGEPDVEDFRGGNPTPGTGAASRTSVGARMPETVVGSLIITYAVVQTILFLLLIRSLDPYEREPLSALGLMTLWGAIGATSLSSIGNLAVKHVLPAEVDIVFGQAIYAPIVEELAKGAALVAFVLLSLYAKERFGIPRFEGVTDGIVYGAAIGLGFAFTEDVLYLLVGASQRGL